MYARVLFAWPPEPGYRPLTNEVAEIEPEIVNTLTRVVDLDGGQGKDGEFAPRSISMSLEAVETFQHFLQFMHAGKLSLDGREREWWSKTPAHALRLAGTLAYIDWAMSGGEEPNLIEDCFMKSALTLVRDYLWPHSRAALRQIGLNERHANERRILRWIAGNKRTEVSLMDIRRDALARVSTLNRHNTSWRAWSALGGCAARRLFKPVAALFIGVKSIHCSCPRGMQKAQKVQEPTKGRINIKARSAFCTSGTFCSR
jgi:hypothetical protein